MKYFFVVFFLLNTFIRSQDDRWVFIASNHDGSSLYYYDTKSVTYEQNTVIVWLKIEYPNKDYDESSKKYFNYSLNKVKYYCGQRIEESLDFFTYYTDGNLKKYDISNKKWDIIPETLGETLYLNFCNN